MLFGQIDFVNCLPITLPLVDGRPELLQLTMGTPGELNKRYQEKELDIGAMSAHYLLSAADFEIIPTLSISSLGAVGSVFLFTKKDLSDLGRSRIGVPFASATSISLLRLLLIEEFALTPEVVYGKDPGPDHPEFDACLMIGDAALAADRWLKESGRKDIRCVDLGQWWRRLYQLPMVFGVWGARKSYVQANREDFEALCAFLGETWKVGLSTRYPDVLSEAKRRTGLSESTLDEYFQRQLDFDFSPAHREGLSLFERLCRQNKLL